jgi:hypothetical protein
MNVDMATPAGSFLSRAQDSSAAHCCSAAKARICIRFHVQGSRAFGHRVQSALPQADDDVSAGVMEALQTMENNDN